MRLFVNFSDSIARNRTIRINTVDCITTTDLIKKIAAECQVKKEWLIIKLKNEIVNFRIVEHWPIEHYPIRNGSWIIVEMLPQGLKMLSPAMESKKLPHIDEELQLELDEDGMSDPKLSFVSEKSDYEWNKYFEESLQKFLAIVRSRSLEGAAAFLKQEPECHSDKIVEKMMVKKTRYLLDEIGECGRSALHWAIQEKDLDMVEFLLIKSCDPNVVSIDNYTPLQLSISIKSADIFQTLIAHPKIDINKTTNKGTALHIAIRQDLANYVQRLLDSGADAQLEDSEGNSAMKLAKSKGMTHVIERKKSRVKVEIPYILRGNVFKVSTFSYRLIDRTLLVNPFTNQFLIYEDKAIEESIKISELQATELILEKSWRMKKQFYYIEVQSKTNRLIFAFKHENIALEWVQEIKKCYKFVKQNNAEVKQEEQLVEVLNDSDGEIKLHKRKISKKTTLSYPSRITLFDIEPAKETEIPQQKKQDKTIVLAEKIQTTQKLQKVEKVEKVQKVENQNEPTTALQFESAILPSEADSYIESTLLDSELIGSVIDSKAFVPLGRRNTINNADFKSDNFRSSLYTEKKSVLVCFTDFQILRSLGNGSFGKVFLARHKQSQNLFALKVLNKKKLMVKKQLKYAVGQANILKKISNPFIVKLHYSFQTPSNLYIALDYCPNGDLAELLSEEEKLTERACKFYIAQLILAVEYLHQIKVIYRDLKPENILIGEDGFIRLTDFNLSKEKNFSLSFCGSPAYLSPEMLDKKGVGKEADIYGIGCVLYEMLVGEPPYFDDDIEVLYSNIRGGKLKFPSQISKSAKSLINSMLERDVSKRIGTKSMQEVKKHQFFNGFDWKQLESLQMKIPQQLTNKMKDESHLGLEVIKDHGFLDTDYDNPNNMMNRIKGFTFVRQN